MKNTIYYFTGTGNSMQVGKYLQSYLTDTRLLRVCKKNLPLTEDKDSERIGFVFPVYYRGIPRMLYHFIEQLNISPKTYFFAVATYGSYPALSFEQINELLMKKGAVLSGKFGIAMPGNMWFMYYPHPLKDFTDRIAEQEVKTIAVAEKIKANAITPFPVISNRNEEKGYYQNKISYIAEIDRGFWTTKSCNHCGMCSKICPSQNILMTPDGPSWLHHCEYCLACIHWCPNTAIEFDEVTKGQDRYHNPCIQIQELL